MMTCETIAKHLPLYLDGALKPQIRREFEAHLASCEGCRCEVREYVEIAAMVRESTVVDISLPSAQRRRIAREAAVLAARRRWTFVLPEWIYSFRPGAAATGAAVVLALLVLPAVLRQREEQPRTADVSTINVTTEGAAVRLAWSDGSRSSYTVYKTSNPRSFGRAETHVVKGDSWVDKKADAAPIVFYRIE